MPVVLTHTQGQFQIPTWVNDLASFRKWVHSGVLPEKLSVHFINGEVWVDFTMEEMFSHNRVKQALNLALGQLIRSAKLGVYCPDGMLITSEITGLGTEPDAVFLSADTLESGAVQFVAGRSGDGEATEILGAPDLVIEIVSPSSVDKDTEWLMSAYFDAGIPEYWVIDARDDDPEFDIWIRRGERYVATRKVKGWVKSPVLARSFRLIRSDAFGLIDYTLEIR